MYETLLNLEKKFFKIKYISDKNWLNDTLHNDFVECGKSGTLFNKREVMEELFFRTSIWVYEKQLQMRFHQATKLSFNVELVRC